MVSNTHLDMNHTHTAWWPWASIHSAPTNQSEATWPAFQLHTLNTTRFLKHYMPIHEAMCPQWWCTQRHHHTLNSAHQTDLGSQHSKTMWKGSPSPQPRCPAIPAAPPSETKLWPHVTPSSPRMDSNPGHGNQKPDLTENVPVARRTPTPPVPNQAAQCKTEGFPPSSWTIEHGPLQCAQTDRYPYVDKCQEQANCTAAGCKISKPHTKQHTSHMITQHIPPRHHTAKKHVRFCTPATSTNRNKHHLQVIKRRHHSVWP